MKIHEYTHGVEIISGLMGSGKTYFAVKRCMRIIVEQRRPVYTNLPLKLPVVRRRLRNVGGEALAQLIQPLSEEHWRRFLRRHRAFAQLREKYAKLKAVDLDNETLQAVAQANETTVEHLRKLQCLHTTQLRAWFEHDNGPNIYEGPEANEIPPFAIIIIDEVQNWHSMIDQSKDPDRMALLDYLTKSRHSVHWVWIITQDVRNISIEFRRLAQSIWHVWQLGDAKLAWGFKFKSLGLRATAYKRYTHDQWEMKERNGDENAQSFVLITQLPWNRRVYRYYEPYTNSGSKRQLERQLRKARSSAGLSATGETESEQMRNQIHNIGKMKKLTGWFISKAKLVIIVAITLVVGMSLSRNKGSEVANETIIQDQQTQIEWPRWTMSGVNPWFGGTRYVPGDFLANGAEFMYASPDGNSLVLALDGAFWLWEYGGEVPERIAPIEDIRSAVAATNIAAAGTGSSVDDAGEPTPD